MNTEADAKAKKPSKAANNQKMSRFEGKLTDLFQSEICCIPTPQPALPPFAMAEDIAKRPPKPIVIGENITWTFDSVVNTEFSNTVDTKANEPEPAIVKKKTPNKTGWGAMNSKNLWF